MSAPDLHLTELSAFPELLSRPPVSSLAELLGWFERSLCSAKLNDPRGHRVMFEPAAFIHLIKYKDAYGKEPKNKKLTIDLIRRGRLLIHQGRAQNYDSDRVADLIYAIELIRRPDEIVANWQAAGLAYPGEVYVRDFGKNGRRKYRCLVCRVLGERRIPVTAFAADSDSRWKDGQKFWP